MSLGVILKLIRKIKHISQKEIAAVLNVSKSTIYRFENGGSISINNYLKYCEYLGIAAYIPFIIHGNDNYNASFKQLANNMYDYKMVELRLTRIINKDAEQIFKCY